ncbi:MAG: hypothetical protein Q8J63_00705 [Candidatus Aquicultor sp.]|nr:hypothetical protein [Candidatus Aquicultor sp.]
MKSFRYFRIEQGENGAIYGVLGGSRNFDKSELTIKQVKELKVLDLFLPGFNAYAFVEYYKLGEKEVVKA